VPLLDSDGRERVRLEGYLPNGDFLATLESGLGRIAFVRKQYADAERWYDGVVRRLAQSHFAPEAMCWRAVVRYQASNDHTVLEKEAVELTRTYPSSVWAKRALPWLATTSKQRTAC
jgi:TolA-binding protein